jgi:uncharacterized cysteine cluster protein YcgN (CxxCxxCC family)
MTSPNNFWKNKTLEELTPQEWEALCDSCGQCCLYKFQDESSGDLLITNVACRFLDIESCRCIAYPQRKSAMPTCVLLNPQKVLEVDWLPPTCAYRLIAEGKPLPYWHPLISGNQESVYVGGISVRGKVISESRVEMNELEKFVIYPNQKPELPKK